MDVAVTRKPDVSQAEVKISATPEEFEPFVEQAARQLTKERALKGFRPGKAPVKVVMEALGQEAVVHAAVDLALPRLFVTAVLEHDLEALGRPATTIEEASLEHGVRFTTLVDVLPEVVIGDVTTIQVERKAAEVTDEQLQQELTYLAKSRSTYLDVARPAQQGDTVVVDFDVMMDGKPLEGGKSANHPVHLGEGHFIPDFETKLTGIQAGDTREFTMKFPDDYGQEALRGKAATVTVKAHAVRKRVIPAIDDAFAKSLGQFADLAALKATMQENMLHERQHHEEDRVRGELAEKLAEVATIPALPVSLVEREVDRRVTEFAELLAMQGKTVDQYVIEREKSVDDVRAEMRPAAEKTVRVSLALRAFARQEKIEVADEDVEREVQAYVQQFKDPQRAGAQVDTEELRTSVINTLRNQKALERLETLAQVTGGPAHRHT